MPLDSNRSTVPINTALQFFLILQAPLTASPLCLQFIANVEPTYVQISVAQTPLTMRLVEQQHRS